MTLIRRRVLPLWAPLLALFLAAGLMASPALGADERNGSTFNAPTYQASPPPQSQNDADRARSPGAERNNTPRGTRADDRRPSAAPAVSPSSSPMSAADDEQMGPRDAARDAAMRRQGEFQRFVEGATGRQLPVFGARFFADPANRASTRDNLPVSGDYTVGPGDEVLIRAWGSLDVDYRTTVDRNGQLSLPRVGSFTVSGIKASELEKHLRAQIGRLYTNFNLSVSLGQLRGVRVFVVGPARLPGVYTVPSQSTLLTAVVAAGGPGPNGSMRKVMLRRGGAVVSELDLYEFLVNGEQSKDVQLVAGDVVVFQPVGPRVALNGEIDNAAIYELKSAQEPVSELLRYAGGSPVLANPNRVLIERINPTRSPAARYVEEFSLDATGLDKPLRDGDVITLLAISPQFANAVTLKGHVAQPLRHVFTPGMRIRDLIPSPDALITPEFHRRKNLLVQMLDERDVSDRTFEERKRTQRHTEDREAAERARKTPAAMFDELNWDYAVIERLNADLSTQVIPFNLGKVVLHGDDAQNLELAAGDVVTVYSQKDMRVPMARQTRLVSLEGEVGAPGVYQLLAGETLPELITRAGGFSPHAYVFGLEFSREETRRRQRENLAEAIARLESLAATQSARDAANRRDESNGDRSASISAAATQAQMTRLSRVQPNGRIALELDPGHATLDQLPQVPLEHGDRIIVPARPGFITVAGAVVNTNALLWKPERTVGDYLKQAGVDEAAELANMFILRADGTVVHAVDRRGFMRLSGLESQVVQPGDAIVVPTQLDFETWGRALVRNLKDIGQIFYQFGLGAAAIKTLRD